LRPWSQASFLKINGEFAGFPDQAAMRANRALLPTFRRNVYDSALNQCACGFIAYFTRASHNQQMETTYNRLAGQGNRHLSGSISRSFFS
jgi:hypothetical protein